MGASWDPSMSESVVVQLLSHVCLFVTPWTAAHQASLSFTLLILQSLSLISPPLLTLLRGEQDLSPGSLLSLHSLSAWAASLPWFQIPSIDTSPR